MNYFYSSNLSPIQGNYGAELITVVKVEIVAYDAQRSPIQGEEQRYYNPAKIQLFLDTWAVIPTWECRYRKNIFYVPKNVRANGFKLFMRPFTKCAVDIETTPENLYSNFDGGEY